MLKRIYVNNYKCLNNFELSFNSINLLLGRSGAGKSSVFQALVRLQALLLYGGKINSLFALSDWTAWVTSPNQTFEVDFQSNDDTYRYALTIRRHKDLPQIEVDSESLWLNEHPLVQFESETVRLYRDDFSLDSTYPYDRSLSAVAQIPMTVGFRRITQFRNLIRQLIIVQLNPPFVNPMSQREEELLLWQAVNFVSWYRFITRDQQLAFDIIQELRAVLDGFRSFEFVAVGEQERVLRANFSNENNGRGGYSYGLDQLSDGERALIMLYSLYHYARAKGATLCIDGPESLVPLPEIQPWLHSLYDACGDGEMQALVISHHPQYIDYLASSVGIWFERESNKPTRVRRLSDESEAGLKLSDLAAKGWIDA